MARLPKAILEVPMVEPRDLIEYASDAATVIDQRRTIIAWNAAAEGLLGRSADKAIGRRCHEVLGAVRSNGYAVCASDGAIAHLKRGRATKKSCA